LDFGVIRVQIQSADTRIKDAPFDVGIQGEQNHQGHHQPGGLRNARFRLDLPAGTLVKPGDEFSCVWHGHVLEHEDNERMRPYQIVG
jgi:hypothetical protein